jgi:hypothetical protein
MPFEKDLEQNGFSAFFINSFFYPQSMLLNLSENIYSKKFSGDCRGKLSFGTCGLTQDSDDKSGQCAKNGLCQEDLQNHFVTVQTVSDTIFALFEVNL